MNDAAHRSICRALHLRDTSRANMPATAQRTKHQQQQHYKDFMQISSSSEEHINKFCCMLTCAHTNAHTKWLCAHRIAHAPSIFIFIEINYDKLIWLQFYMNIRYFSRIFSLAATLGTHTNRRFNGNLFQYILQFANGCMHLMPLHCHFFSLSLHDRLLFFSSPQ